MWQTWFNSEKIHSDLNGEITLRTFFGYQVVLVEGYYQSGNYINALIRKMLGRIPHSHKVRNVLMLGLGGGGGIAALHKRFPDAHIVTIEHDPVMVDLSKRLVFDRINFTPEVILQDAEAALGQLVFDSKQFDVIVSDLFRGQQLSPLLGSERFLQLLQKALTPEGYLAVNLFHNAPKIEVLLRKKFSLWDKLRYSYNHMQIYRHFGLGNVDDPIPEWFISRQQSKLFLEAQTRLIKATQVGSHGAEGLRYVLGPLALETYTSQTPFTLEPWKGLRLVVWSPLLTPKPNSGWFSKPFATSGWQLGITHSSPDYWSNWSQHAQRHLKKWQSTNQYRIKELTPKEFEQGYHASGKLDRFMRGAFMREISSHYQTSPENTHIMGVIDTTTDQVIAGLVTTDYMDIGQSCHLVSFIHPDMQKTPIGYGLISNWYERCLQKGIKCLNFGVIAKDSDPKAWKGYSAFKRQFGLYLIKYAPDQLKLTLKI